MCPQNVCIRGCKITLVAFVCLFSTVHFKMSLQTACPRRCIVTVVAFVWLNDIIRCVVLCPNGCFQLSHINDWNLVKKYKCYWPQPSVYAMQDKDTKSSKKDALIGLNKTTTFSQNDHLYMYDGFIHVSYSHHSSLWHYDIFQQFPNKIQLNNISLWFCKYVWAMVDGGRNIWGRYLRVLY